MRGDYPAVTIMARRSRPTSAKGPPTPVGHFMDWLSRAVAALERTHGVARGSVPARVWRHAYVLGLTPEQGADHAARSAYNVRPASERLHKHRW